MPIKPSEKEEEYFARMEYERKKTIEQKKLTEESLSLLLTNLSVEDERQKKLDQFRDKGSKFVFNPDEEEKKEKLKDLHFMKCPKCGMQLIEIDYKRIKVDKCSECEGIWLDAGELETISKLEKKGLDKLFSVFKK